MLRLATPDDISVLYEIMTSTGFVAYTMPGMTRLECYDRILALINTTSFLVFINENELVGYSLIADFDPEKFPVDVPYKNYAYGDGIGIRKDFQGKGLGKVLKQETIDFVESLGYTGMYTCVSEKNIRSQQLQLSTGFSEVARFVDVGRPDGSKSILYRLIL